MSPYLKLCRFLFKSRSIFSHTTKDLRDHPTILGHEERKTLVQTNEEDTDFLNTFFEACSPMSDGDDNDDVMDHFFHLYCFQEVYYVCMADDPDFKDQKV